ncbi:MAG: preprotein translocase subunit SecA [Acidobacteria bacterium]|nr:preprotein translocase subunit SecA [Acidobacteriota bacterium]
MFDTILKKIVGSQSERDMKRLAPSIVEINRLEPAIAALSAEQLRAKTGEFKEKLNRGATLEDILPEAFAVVREAGKRTLNMRHYDVQLIGGIVLHQGKIAEMKTGEGKTLVATLPVYLNSLEGKGVHVVTVNDYLARRDSEWMGRIYHFLGLSVGVIQHDLDDAERQAAYRCDVTYGTNNEFGFDYLRDNMKFELSHCVQREHGYGIVDEVDSILIDEARTPLIISGPAEESTDKYYKVDKLIPRLTRDIDYLIDEKARTVTITEEGVEKAEKFLGVGNLYDPRNMEWVHHVQQGLRAHTLFQKDVDYLVKEAQVVIVDEFTGRQMPGRRYSDGLHQALEAKEGVRIERENQTLATITFQNYFRMYKKLAGMTGTAETEAEEFHKTYKLEVVAIPTNKPLNRVEHSDVIYRTEREKFEAVVDEIQELNQSGRPVLVGTIAIEKSERLSVMLKRNGIKHVVLNAKYHEKEAEIVSQAGRKGAVTVATNMAGRGTDILLGGNAEFLARQVLRDQGIDPVSASEEEYQGAVAEVTPAVEQERKEVVAVGGLHILGTERHEARRIDNQLRGRAGRQGDPGSSRFYLSLEDDLLRIFAGERISGLMQKLGMEEGIPIESKMITRQIERAQRQVEARNFEIRKHLLEYDDVMNKQRAEIYRMRRELLEGKEQRQYIMQLAEELLIETLDLYAGQEQDPEEWEVANLQVNLDRIFALDLKRSGIDLSKVSRNELQSRLWDLIRADYEAKENQIGPEVMRFHERMIMLQIIDNQWKDHLLALDHLKEGIGLRGYGQRDPLVEYKKESFDMFEDLWNRITEEIVRYMFLLRPVTEEEQREIKRRRRQQPVTLSAPAEDAAAQGGSDAPVRTVQRSAPKVGRNDPCPCGSGKKYKKCHGA